MILNLQQKFINREKELEFLEKKYKEEKPQLIIIYGRRRVGKTELIKQFIKNKKAIYFLSLRENPKENLELLAEEFYKLTNKNYFLDIKTKSFYRLFELFSQEIEKEKEKIVLVIDEFPYLIESSRAVLSEFQKIWDELLFDKNIMLILSGSSVSIMEKEVLSYKSPLYGRRTGQWKITPLNFEHLKEFFPNYGIEDLIKVYGCLDGIPYYLLQFDPNKSWEENLKNKILTKGEILYLEGEFLLREEFREPKTYLSILKYMALGYNTHGELISVTGIDRGNLSKYLSVLENLEIIEYILPLGQRKRGIYKIKDKYFNFWLRFIYPNLSNLELLLVEEVFKKIKKDLNSYLGFVFEDLITDLIKRKKFNFNFDYNLVKKWWKKDKEIDLIALNEQTKEILFCECKWKDKVNAEKVVKELVEEKIPYVDWNNNDRKESIAVFAKSFSKRIEEFDGRKVYCFDLRDLEMNLKK
jgi:AAA+ ATPase superfamily predicted ATPase